MKWKQTSKWPYTINRDVYKRTQALENENCKSGVELYTCTVIKF